MNREMIYLIRENKDLYQYLKYNSYLYKNILRNEISIKELEKLMKKELKQTPVDKLNEMKNKIELANTFLNILK
jgi:hypothetical protein